MNFFRHSDEFELKPLSKLSDVQKIYSVWPMADRNPFETLLNATKHSPSVAAFTKDGTPVAWIFRYKSFVYFAMNLNSV